MEQASSAKYIVQQYIVATGGRRRCRACRACTRWESANCASEFHLGDQTVTAAQGHAEVGGFVLWQKCPEVWYFELIMAGHKMSTSLHSRWHCYEPMSGATASGIRVC